MNNIPANVANGEIIRYDPEVDILSIFLKKGKAADSKWLDNNTATNKTANTTTQRKLDRQTPRMATTSISENTQTTIN